MAKRTLIMGLAAAVAAITSAPVQAACQLGQYIELPVTTVGRRAVVTTKIGGKDAPFIVDSGAFYSTMSRAAAAEFGLKLNNAPDWLRLRGVNGDASASVTTVHDFGIGKVTLPRVDFLVGGTAMGTVGLLGQNFLGIGDVEYDFPHGTIRLLHAHDCPLGVLPYWAGSRPVTVIQLEKRNPPFETHTIGTVTLNGVKLRAGFDSGAERSVLTLAAAKRAGLTPTSPGVESGGMSGGLGTNMVRMWIGPFDKLDFGGEMIPKPKLLFGDVQLGGIDMLIGIDFFLTHRIYVANGAAKMLMTYEGGPLFGLNPKRAVDASGTAIDLTDKTAEPTDAEGFSRRGAALASNGKLDAALADFDRAVALAPNEARYLRLRARLRLQKHEPGEAMTDLDKAISLDPAEPEARMLRAMLHMTGHNVSAAHEDLKAADRSFPPSADARLSLSGMFEAAEDDEAALASVEAWLRFHTEDANRPNALNSHCWLLARLDRQLDKALADCDNAIRLRPNTAAFLDSRALVRLRRGEWRPALADYDAALKLNPRLAWSLYARSVVKKKLGDASGADADRKAAIALTPGIVQRGVKLGLEG